MIPRLLADPAVDWLMPRLIHVIETVLKNLVLPAKLPSSHQTQQHHNLLVQMEMHTLSRRATLRLKEYARLGR